jgi:transposase
MAKRYRVTLEAEERERLRRLISSGKGAARRLTHARILLQADEAEGGPAWADRAIAEALSVSVPTVERVRQRFVEGGLEAALNPRPSRRLYRRKLDGAGEAHLVALTCSAPPDGHERWTLRLLAGRMVALGHVASLAHETVRETLKKTSSSRG